MADGTPAQGAPPRRGFFARHWRKLLLVPVVAAIGGAVARKRLEPKPVTAVPVTRGEAVEAVYATGTVEAADRVVVKAKTSGTIAEIFVKEGSAVKKGDLLARIDNPVATFDLKRGKVDLGAASQQASSAPQVASLAAQIKGFEADLDVAKRNRDRLEGLLKTGAIAEAEVDPARARVTQLEAQISSARSQQLALRIDLDANQKRQAAVVDSLAARLSDTEVRAPQDGVVLTKSIEVGEVVVVNQTLFKVGDVRSLVLEVMVDEADVARVSDGQGGQPASIAAVSLYAYPKRAFAGKVYEILPDANRERKAFLTKIRFDAPPPGLRSGMTGEVNVVCARKPGVLLAPSEAEEESQVWVARGGRATRQKVGVGVRDLLRFEVTEGLAEGDLVIVQGQAGLTEGARLGVTERPMRKDEPQPDPNQPKK